MADAHPGEPVIRRHVGVDPIPATTWATAVFAGCTPEESRTDEQQAAGQDEARILGDIWHLT